MPRRGGFFRFLEGASDLIQGISDAQGRAEEISQILREEGSREQSPSPEDPPLIQGVKLVDAYARRVSERSRPVGDKLADDLDRIKRGLEKVRGK